RRFEFPETFVPSLEHSLAVVARWNQELEKQEAFRFAVRSVTDGELLGGCGVASRAVALACTVAFEELGLQTIEIAADADNTFSRRVALRNGFVEVGTRNGQILYRRVPIGSRQ